MLILLTSETNKLSVSTKPLDKVREQLNEKLGISELSPTNNGGEIGAQGGSSAPPIKLFAKLPKQILDSGLEKPELMRLSAVYELIETEIDYVQDLKTMINVSIFKRFALFCFTFHSLNHIFILIHFLSFTAKKLQYNWAIMMLTLYFPILNNYWLQIRYLYVFFIHSNQTGPCE